MAYAQATRRLQIQTPLGDDVLLLRAFSGDETLSRLFHFDLELLSENNSISYDAIVGKNVTVGLALADDQHQRYWNGYVSRFYQAGRDSSLAVYRGQMVPWFWFLNQTTDCRIFQNKTVPDIITQIFGEYGFTDFEKRLAGSYSEREYCVQYRETDFNFISRLMEEEGIYYFFEHTDGKHVLVMADSPGAHKVCKDQPTAKCALARDGVRPDDRVFEWVQEEAYRPGKITTTDYNFEMPSTKLLATVQGQRQYELYDYPGEYKTKGEGDGLARIRLQEQQTPVSIARAVSDCRGFSVGYKFSLQDHYRSDLNKSYVLTTVSHNARHGLDYRSGSSDEDRTEYSNVFRCVPDTTQIRAARTTRVPIVTGCQTAVVVGPPGEEIYTDKYGRVKVQFHWDREGKFNENSSCWIRVSHPWAGKGWGGIQIPRIGQEVVVDFLEGDPDRPLITGRVYNAGSMPPWDLPAKKVVSGLMSNSTKGGGGFNELSFDDTKGNELMNLHAQYDMATKVEHDQRATIVHDQTNTVTTGQQTNTVTTGKQTNTVKQEIVVTSQAAHIHVTAETEITLKVGASTLYMDKDGTIVLDGKYIKIHGATMVDINP
jgi:type VI secretion system secreted protein VgrG